MKRGWTAARIRDILEDMDRINDMVRKDAKKILTRMIDESKVEWDDSRIPILDALSAALQRKYPK